MRWIRHPGRDLDAFVDGELPRPVADRVETHIGRCRVCRRRLEVTLRARRALREMFELG